MSKATRIITTSSPNSTRGTAASARPRRALTQSRQAEVAASVTIDPMTSRLYPSKTRARSRPAASPIAAPASGGSLARLRERLFVPVIHAVEWMRDLEDRGLAVRPHDGGAVTGPSVIHVGDPGVVVRRNQVEVEILE